MTTLKNKAEEPSPGYEMPITDISKLDMDKVYNYAHYLSWKFNERVELIKGKIFKMSPAPNRNHQGISGNLFMPLKAFLTVHNCKVYAAPFDVRFPNNPDDKNPYTVVQPDICVICDLTKLDDKGCVGAPDMIIEILSPSTAAKDVKDKFELYEEHGVKEYWIVDPENNILDIFLLNDTNKYQLKGKFNAEQRVVVNSIPGLEINLAEIFAD